VPAATAACAHEAAAALGVQDAAALSTETFWQWVIEDKFVEADDARVLSAAGVTVVSDVGPYEDAKLRMLNGSHSALACIAVLMGLPTVFDAVSQPAIRLFLFQLMSAEVIPNLARSDLPAYRDALLQRFANPEVRHGVHQIASDSSKKIGLRWVPSILAQLQAGAPVSHHAFAAAAWMRYCSGRDDQGLSYVINDPQAELMQGIAQSNQADVEKTVTAYMRVESIWGPSLAGNTRWENAVARWLHAINSEGVGRALQILVDEREGR
jgi:fructuronate reductase